MDVSPIQVLAEPSLRLSLASISLVSSVTLPANRNWFLVGLILGDVQTGLIVGGTYQLMTMVTCLLVVHNHLIYYQRHYVCSLCNHY